MPLPASYATIRYNGIHSFGLVAADGTRRWARYRWEPEAGEGGITDEEAAAKPADYLAAELAERLAAGPVAFRLVWQFAGDDADVTDPTVPFPDDAPSFEAGRLELTSVPPD